MVKIVAKVSSIKKYALSVYYNPNYVYHSEAKVKVAFLYPSLFAVPVPTEVDPVGILQ